MDAAKKSIRGETLKQIISVLYGLGEQAGGVTRVSLTRTEALASPDTHSKMALLSYDDNLETTFENLVAQGRISSEISILNIYKWFAEKNELARKLRKTPTTSTLEHVKIKVRRRAEHINQLDVKVVRYFTDDETLFLEEYYKGNGEFAMAALFQSKAPTLKFNSLRTFQAYWLNEICKNYETTHLIADAIHAAETICMVDAERAHKVLMMHSNHLMKPYTPGSEVAAKYHGVIKSIPKADRLVLLTHAQLSDLTEQFPCDRYRAIGNPINVAESQNEVAREKNLAVIVARLHSIKRIKNMIKAFTKVVEALPDARLEIWGSGEQKDELQAEIDKLNANTSIKLMGFATDVSGIFRRASVSLAMSATEGFGVSFAESLAYGTPLVSIDTNYGPKEIITNGVDGFIVKTEKEFVEKTCLLLSNHELSVSMGKAGIINMERFHAETITQRWVELFEEIENNPHPVVQATADENTILTNTAASKFGWIYLPKTEDPATIDKYKTAKSVVIRQVLTSKKFLGEPTDLSKGIHEVDEMMLDEPKGLYRFRAMKHGTAYKGIIAAESVEFAI
ncbi:hypothetical protein TZ03_26990 [Pseudomonas sp. 10-1B]|nr:hypothetical protein TZ03_26990 [Pseudomonas sp. 10-1B]